MRYWEGLIAIDGCFLHGLVVVQVHNYITLLRGGGGWASCGINTVILHQYGCSFAFENTDAGESYIRSGIKGNRCRYCQGLRSIWVLGALLCLIGLQKSSYS